MEKIINTNIYYEHNNFTKNIQKECTDNVWVCVSSLLYKGKAYYQPCMYLSPLPSIGKKIKGKIW